MAEFLDRAIDGALDVLLARHVGELGHMATIGPNLSPVI